jgi:hypothetical protein
MKKFYYQKLFFAVIVLFVISSCVSEQERLRLKNEEEQKDSCMKSIYFIEEQSIKRPYKVIDIAIITVYNNNENSATNYLKQLACKKMGNVLSMPVIERGPQRSTFTSKVIAWEDNK